MGNVRDVFNEECAGVKINFKFFKEICDLETRFVNKKPDHIEFFGGTLTGVQTVRFTPDDTDRLFTDILMIDDRYLEERIYAVRDEDGKPPINPEYKVSGNVFNLTCVWIIHAFEKSPYLDEKQRREGQIRICMYLMYKFLTSILYNNFKYPADPDIAKATYAQLSYKFLLKQCGSWGQTIRYMAENMTSTAFKDGQSNVIPMTILNMDNDYGVVSMLNSISGAVKSIVKNITSQHYLIKKGGDRIGNSSSVMEVEGEFILKDKTKSLANYSRYIKSTMSDQNSFIKQELVDVIVSIMHTMPEKLLVKSLVWTSKHYGQTTDRIVEKSVDVVLEHAFEYLMANDNLLGDRGDIATMLSKLRGAYMSSRSTEPRLLDARQVVGKVIKLATQSKNESVIASTRTGWMLYICLRALTMKHYTNQ